MERFRRSRRVLNALVTVVLAMAGCTADDAPVRSATDVATPAADPGPTTSPSPRVVAPPHTVSPAPTPTPPPVVLAPFDVERALAVTTALVEQVGERVPGTPGGVAARTLVAAALTDAGWTVEHDQFDLPQGGTSANVVASWDRRGRDGGPHVVVGAHLDTFPGTVGANDNATGIGVLVALAEELADEAATLPVPVVLVAFDAEEFQGETGVHHVGSQHHAATAPAPLAMLAIDMVGDGPRTLVVAMEGATTALVDRVVAVAARAGITDVEAASAGDISDHGPFARRGVPAGFLWTGRDGRLHTPDDTLDHLDVDDLERAGAIALAWLRDLGDADTDGLQPAS